MMPHTISVMNRIETDDGVSYYPTIVKGVLYADKRASINAVTGVDNVTKVSCTIPFNIENYSSYVNPISYNSLSLNEKLTHWTLREDDIIVLGEVQNVQLSLKQINNTYNDKFVVRNVNNNNYGALKHFQVGGS